MPSDWAKPKLIISRVVINKEKKSKESGAQITRTIWLEFKGKTESKSKKDMASTTRADLVVSQTS